MQTAAAPTRPLSCVQAPEPPKRSRPLSSYRKPVPTEAELELRQLRSSKTLSTIDMGAVHEPIRTALDMPRATDPVILWRESIQTATVSPPPHRAASTWHGPLLPQTRAQQDAAPPPQLPLQVAAWFWLLLDRIKAMGRMLIEP